MWTLQPRFLANLLEVLRGRGYRVVGPVVRDGAIRHENLVRMEDLALGWVDEQGPGSYRLARSEQDGLFAYAVGADSWKRFLHPPAEVLWRVTKDPRGLHLKEESPMSEKLALFGARPCELAAIAIQDRVFLEGPFRDSFYEAHRKDLFVVALNCSRPSANCFCASMKTGPRATTGFDLCLTEIRASGEDLLLAETGSEAGKSVLAEVPHLEASDEEQAAARETLREAERRIMRQLDTADLQDLFNRNIESPHWDEVARRCLGCANCTMVCPTCFCTTILETSDLAGTEAARTRVWDSCFTKDFTYIHGGSVRPSGYSRYRQWISHKLSSWIEQFGISGCVGCGRCITWCPVGIDITAEVEALRAREQVGFGPKTGGSNHEGDA